MLFRLASLSLCAASVESAAVTGAECDDLIGKQVEVIESGLVGTLTGYTVNSEAYHLTLSHLPFKMRLNRDEFRLAELREGSRVVLRNLDTQAIDGEDDFNGKRGTVTNADDLAQVRVILDQPAERRKQWTFPEENLTIVGYADMAKLAAAQTMLHRKVRLQGAANPEVEGRVGEVVTYVPELDSFDIELDGAGEAIKAVVGVKLVELVLLDE